MALEKSKAADKPTSVYIIASGDYVKIGYSVDPQKRLKGMSSGFSERPHLASTRQFDDRATAHYVEKLLHWRFRSFRSHGEWFRIPVREAKSALQRCRTKPLTQLEASKSIAAIFDAAKETPRLF